MIEEEDAPGGSDEEGAPVWMATFADMMSLLLTFFVLILSFANMDVIKFSAAVESLRDALGNAIALQEFDGAPRINPFDLDDAGLPRVVALELCQTGPNSSALRAEVETLVQRLDLENLVEVDEAEGGVVVRVVGQLLFDAGSIELRPESFVLLNEIARLIAAVPELVSIEGHTDVTPAATGSGMSNWHLSTGRAISVLDYLTRVKNVDPKRLNVSGYAAMRPLLPNDSDANRERNRRVEFVFRRAKTPKQNPELQQTASR